MKLIDAEQYRKEFLDSRDFEPMKILDLQPTVNAVPIPEGATNGDMIMTMFNCMVIGVSKGKVYVERIYFPFDEDWWNAPYKREVKESEDKK